MYIRKSHIQDAIDKAVNIAETKKDDFWKKEMMNELERKEDELLLELSCKESEIKMLNRRILELDKRIKIADEKYFKGRALIKKARYILCSLSEEHTEVLKSYQIQGQRFKALESELEDSERNLIIQE